MRVCVCVCALFSIMVTFLVVASLNFWFSLLRRLTVLCATPSFPPVPLSRFLVDYASFGKGKIRRTGPEVPNEIRGGERENEIDDDKK